MDELSEIAALALDSVADDAAFVHLGEAIARQVNSATLHLHLHRPEGVEQLAFFGHDPWVARAYDAHFWRIDPWAAHLARAPGKVMLGEEAIAPEALIRTEIYNDLMRPSGDILHCVAVSQPAPGGGVSIIGANRARRQAAFGEKERATLGRLSPLFARTLEARSRRLAGHGRVADRLMDADPDPVLVLNRARVVRYANAAALRALEAAAGPLVRLGAEVGGRDADGSARLTVALTLACDARLGQGLRLPLPGEDEARLAVDPLPGPGEALAVVRWRDEAERRHAEFARLRARFQLTPAEAALATSLLAGRSLAAHGARAGVRITTVRSHLQRLFEKTGAARQAELVVRLRARD